MLSYTLFKYCYPFGPFDPKETKKRQILGNNKPNCADYPQLSEPDTMRAHRGIAPKFHTLSADMSGGSCEFDTLFLRFLRFDTLVAKKKIPFLRDLFTRMMYRPQ